MRLGLVDHNIGIAPDATEERFGPGQLTRLEKIADRRRKYEFGKIPLSPGLR